MENYATYRTGQYGKLKLTPSEASVIFVKIICLLPMCIYDQIHLLSIDLLLACTTVIDGMLSNDLYISILLHNKIFHVACVLCLIWGGLGCVTGI